MASGVVKMLIVPTVIACIVSTYPWILNMQVANITYLGGTNVLVSGSITALRDGENWCGPDSLPYFQAWWASEEAEQKVYEQSLGTLTLVAIDWVLVESDDLLGQDVLGFQVVLKVNPSAVYKTSLWKPPFVVEGP